MAAFHAPKHLVKRGDIYYFRMAIPTALRDRFGGKELKSSLHTDDRRIARIRCRHLTNKFEKLFRVAVDMSELTQDKLQDIARGYFRELLIQDNDRIFWIEEMWGNDPSDRQDTIDSAQDRHAYLKGLYSNGQAVDLASSLVARKLADLGLKDITRGSDSHAILCDYFVRAQMESASILRAKLEKDFPATVSADPLLKAIFAALNMMRCFAGKIIRMSFYTARCYPAKITRSLLIRSMEKPIRERPPPRCGNTSLFVKTERGFWME